MKVLHIVAGSLSGGAGRGAYWLHLGLKSLGVKSVLLTNSKDTSGFNSAVSIAKTKKGKVINWIRLQLESLLPRLYNYNKNILFSSGLFGTDFTKTDEYKDADIIHLHWINNGLVNVKHLAKIDKPIVWTMRDMWPLTGGCHYSMECEKYKTGCGSCDMLGSKMSYDLSRFVVKRKKKYIPRHTRVVGISRWLSDCAKDSLIFRDFNITTIHNAIDTSEFLPINKSVARDILNLPMDKKIILTGANNHNDTYKGFSKLLAAYKRLPKDYFLLFFGKVNKQLIDELGFEYKSLGYLSDTISMRLAYSSADVFVASSIMEAFGKTIVESMACKTPVVCFDATGPKDIVTHLQDGYKAKPFDIVDLANGISTILELEHTEFDGLCENARNKAVSAFDSKKIAKQYIDLYRELCSNLARGEVEEGSVSC